MKLNFHTALAATLREEGGYSDHPDDPGGKTLQGVTQATYDNWRREHRFPVRSVREMVPAERDAIYRENYWNHIRGDELPSGIDFAVFDFAVNSGPTRAARYLQMVLRVTADGQIGPKTLAAARAADPVATINALCDKRLNFLLNLPTWEVFGRGWSKRIGRVRTLAVQMADDTHEDTSIIFSDPAEPAGTSFWSAIWSALVLFFPQPNTGK